MDTRMFYHKLIICSHALPTGQRLCLGPNTDESRNRLRNPTIPSIQQEWFSAGAVAGGGCERIVFPSN
jgi:hypothetical protein